MELFTDAHSVRLLGHKGKYLWAGEDKKSVAQKSGKDSYGVIWRVELVPDRNTIRLKSVYDLYLMASDYAFLLGATGKKVMQSFASKADSSLEWEPVGAGNFVKLMTKGEKFLRANGGMPPYRNSITHDVPVLASNQHVVLWEVEVVRKKDSPSMTPSRMMSPQHSNAARPKSPPAPPQPQPQPEISDDEEIPAPAPVNVHKPRPRSNPVPQPEVVTSDDEEIPAPAPVNVHKPRPRSNPVPQPEVVTSDDEEIPAPAPVNVHKPRPRTNPGSTKIETPPTPEYSSSEPASPKASPPPRRRASPPPEPVRNRPARRRGSPPREAYDQSPPHSESVRNRPARRRGSPPRQAYDQSPPHSESVRNAPARKRGSPPREAYDPSPPPRRRASPSGEPDYDQSPPQRRRAPLPSRDDYGSSASEPSSPRGHHSHRPAAQRRTPLPTRDDYDSSPSEPSPPRQNLDEQENAGRSRSQEGKSADMRRIFYSVAEDDGEVLAHDDETYGTFMFKGHSLAELTRELQRATGINDDIILCMRNPLSAKLYKMRLALPQNSAPLSIVIVRSNSQFGRTFASQPSRQR